MVPLRHEGHPIFALHICQNGLEGVADEHALAVLVCGLKFGQEVLVAVFVDLALQDLGQDAWPLPR
jgi:hypothetical protein